MVQSTLPTTFLLYPHLHGLWTKRVFLPQAPLGRHLLYMLPSPLVAAKTGPGLKLLDIM
jgi:hypothetical protein